MAFGADQKSIDNRVLGNIMADFRIPARFELPFQLWYRITKQPLG